MTVDSVDLGLPHITVLETIGRGGFSVVYKAHDSKLNRHVAVKVLTAVVDQGDLDRFQQECQIHGPLSNHPNIVTIHDAGYTPDGKPFLVMEYLDAGSLSDRLDTAGPMTWQKAVELMAPVCDAVESAHRMGVLHRDIKPANILLSADGPKLADFGIACVSDATSPQFAVSWLHAPPEAEKNRRDERSDVYSLASTMYQLLAGHAPFERRGQDNLVSLLRRIVEEPAPQLNSSVVPAWLDALLQRSLAKDPTERPASAAEFGAALINGPALESAATRPLALVTPALGQPQAHPHFLHTNPTHQHTYQQLATHQQVAHLPTTAAPLLHSQDHSYEPAPGYRAAYQPAKPARSKMLPIAAAVLALATVGFFLSPAWAALSPGNNRGSASSSVDSGDDQTDTQTGTQTDVTQTEDTQPDETSTTADASTTTSSESTTTTEKDEEVVEEETTTTETTPPPPPPPAEAEVPNVAGLSQAQAIDELEAEGFTDISVAIEASNAVDDGLVISTSPGQGSVVELDTPIVLTVSSGPEQVEVPSLLGLDEGAAINAAGAAGLDVNISYVAVVADSDDDGRVLSQDREPGVTAPAGSTINLTVGQAESGPVVTVPPVIAPPDGLETTTTLGLVAPGPTL